jgi:hypothetical protein
MTMSGTELDVMLVWQVSRAHASVVSAAQKQHVPQEARPGHIYFAGRLMAEALALSGRPFPQRPSLQKT